MASNLIVARGAAEITPPISLAFWRWLLAFFILFLFTHKEILKKTIFIKKEFFSLFFLGATSAGICGAFPFIAGHTTTVINMGIIYSSSPVFIIIFSYLLFSIKLKIIQTFGLILYIIGVLTIIAKGNFGYLLNLKFSLGDFWILGASISWAIYSVYQIKIKSEFTVFSRVTLIAFFGCISLFPFLFIEKYYFFSNKFSLTFIFWISFAAISPSIIAFFLYANLQKFVGANIAGLVVYLYPVYGAIYGYFLFNEQLKFYHLIGTTLIFFGIVLSNNFKKHW